MTINSVTMARSCASEPQSKRYKGNKCPCIDHQVEFETLLFLPITEHIHQVVGNKFPGKKEGKLAQILQQRHATKLSRICFTRLFYRFFLHLFAPSDTTSTTLELEWKAPFLVSSLLSPTSRRHS